MQFKHLSEAIGICRKANVTPFIWGVHGLGKSSLVAQYAIANKMGCIDFRCSQIEAADLRGLPDKVNGHTAFLPPVDMPYGGVNWSEFFEEFKKKPEKEKDAYWNQMQPRLNEGILFLDEITRAQDDVLQAIFQLVLDRKIGAYTLPVGWSVVCASNFMEGYIVNGFTDPAFLDRFTHLILANGEETLEEWVSHIAGKHGPESSPVIEFATQNIDHLDGKVEAELGFNVTPSRRSWDAVVRVLTACKDGTFSDRAKDEVIAGLVGRELSIAFRKYSCPVKPRDIIAHGITKDMEERLAKLDRGQHTGLTWGMVGFVKQKIETDDKVAETVLDYIEWMCAKGKEKDLIVGFCLAIIDCDNDMDENIKTALISNWKLGSLLAKKGSKKFISRLQSRPALAKLLSATAWGNDRLDDKKKTKDE